MNKQINRKKNKHLRRRNVINDYLLLNNANYSEEINEGIFLRYDGAMVCKQEGWKDRSKYKPKLEDRIKIDKRKR